MTKFGQLQCYDDNKYIKDMQICLNYYWATESFRFLNQVCRLSCCEIISLLSRTTLIKLICLFRSQ